MANFIPADYIDVQERITRFWEEHQLGRIETDLMSPPDDFTQCRYVARVYRNPEDERPAATGWAFELAGGQGANRTSHEENCETSAIGRALANLGYATRGADRPSRQEMEKVQRGQNPPPAERRQNDPPRPPNTPNGAGFAPQGQNRPQAGPGLISDKQIAYLFRLAGEVNLDKGVSNEDFVHGQVYARFTKASVRDLTKQEASIIIDAFQSNDLVDAVMPPPQREDQTERRQQEPSFGGMAGPSEPAWMGAAPDVGEPEYDRHTA